MVAVHPCCPEGRATDAYLLIQTDLRSVWLKRISQSHMGVNATSNVFPQLKLSFLCLAHNKMSFAHITKETLTTTMQHISNHPIAKHGDHHWTNSQPWKTAMLFLLADDTDNQLAFWSTKLFCFACVFLRLRGKPTSEFAVFQLLRKHILLRLLHAGKISQLASTLACFNLLFPHIVLSPGNFQLGSWFEISHFLASYRAHFFFSPSFSTGSLVPFPSW